MMDEYIIHIIIINNNFYNKNIKINLLVLIFYFNL